MQGPPQCERSSKDCSRKLASTTAYYCLVFAVQLTTVPTMQAFMSLFGDCVSPVRFGTNPVCAYVVVNVIIAHIPYYLIAV